MEGWRLLQQVPQLKWTLAARGTPVLNESELAILILRILIQMTSYYPSRDGDGAIIRPLPTVMRVLSEPNTLPHIVQLLVTFDPVIGRTIPTYIPDPTGILPHKVNIFFLGCLQPTFYVCWALLAGCLVFFKVYYKIVSESLPSSVTVLTHKFVIFSATDTGGIQ